jgi:hypothetical protein
MINGNISYLWRTIDQDGHVQRFLSTVGPNCEHVCPRRHRMKVEAYRRKRAPIPGLQQGE